MRSGSATMSPTAEHRVERSIRVLEHVLHLPADVAQPVAREAADRLPVEHDAASRRRHETHDGAAGRGLAAAGFADQASVSPAARSGSRRRRHAPIRSSGAGARSDREMHLQVLDGRAAACADRGTRSLGDAPLRRPRDGAAGSSAKWQATAAPAPTARKRDPPTRQRARPLAERAARMERAARRQFATVSAAGRESDRAGRRALPCRGTLRSKAAV